MKKDVRDLDVEELFYISLEIPGISYDISKPNPINFNIGKLNINIKHNPFQRGITTYITVSFNGIILTNTIKGKLIFIYKGKWESDFWDGMQKILDKREIRKKEEQEKIQQILSTY